MTDKVLYEDAKHYTEEEYMENGKLLFSSLEKELRDKDEISYNDIRSAILKIMRDE